MKIVLHAVTQQCSWLDRGGGVYELISPLCCRWSCNGRGRMLTLRPGWRWNGANLIVDNRRTLIGSAVHDWIYTTHQLSQCEADALWSAMSKTGLLEVGSKIALSLEGYRGWESASAFEKEQAAIFGTLVM